MVTNPETICLIFIGLMLCTVGCHIFRISTAIAGFILGINIGYFISILGLHLSHSSSIDGWEPMVIVLTAIIFGIAGIFLAKSMIKLFLFLTGFIFGTAMTLIASGRFYDEFSLHVIKILFNNISFGTIVAGTLVGIFFVFFEKALIIFCTSALGAYILAGVWQLNLLSFYAILLIGAGFQFYTSKKITIKNLQITNN